MTPLDALKEAIRIAGKKAGKSGAHGGQTALADVVGCSQSAISQMVRLSKKCGMSIVLKVEDHTGVSRYDLRPDIYGERPKDMKDEAA